MEINPVILGVQLRTQILVVSRLVRMEALGLRVRVIRQRSLIRS